MSQEQLIDLAPKQLGLLKKIIKQHIPDKTVWVYGSRVTWKADEASDIDLTVFNCTNVQIYELKETLEESDLLFTVDVMNWEEIADSFRANIKKQYVVLQEKNKLTGWREVKLGDVIEIIGGGTPKTSVPEYWGGDIPWLAPPDFIGSNRWVEKTKKSITQLGFNRSSTKLLHQGDVIISARGTVGALAQIKRPMAFSQTNYGLRAKKHFIKPDFLFYTLKSNLSNIKQFAYGTVFDTITTKTFNEVKISLPPLLEQKSIAEVLSSLDDKIDLLHRQNKTLENMAQTLFRQWFVEQADAEWEERPLCYFGDIICGKTPSKKVHEYFGGIIPFIKIPDMHGNTFVFDAADTLTEEGKNSQNNKTLPAQSICVSCIATVGLVSMNAFESQTNQQINSIIPKKDEYRYFIYLFMKSSNDLLHAMASGGTATMNLNTGNFSKIMIPMADEYLVSTFHIKVKPVFDKIFPNYHHR